MRACAEACRALPHWAALLPPRLPPAGRAAIGEIYSYRLHYRQLEPKLRWHDYATAWVWLKLDGLDGETYDVLFSLLTAPLEDLQKALPTLGEHVDVVAAMRELMKVVQAEGACNLAAAPWQPRSCVAPHVCACAEGVPSASPYGRDLSPCLPPAGRFPSGKVDAALLDFAKLPAEEQRRIYTDIKTALDQVVKGERVRTWLKLQLPILSPPWRGSQRGA